MNVHLFSTIGSGLSRQRPLSATEQEQRFRDFAEAASEWFWEMDETLKFCWFSERFEEIAGVPQHYLLGKSRRDLLTANDPVTDEITSLEDWWNHVADLEGHRPFKSFVHSRVHPDGHKVYLSISGKPIFDDGGVFVGYRGIGADVTHRIETEQRLRAAKRQADAANRAKSEFLATMSHELRTPLNAIIGFSDMIRQEMNGPVGSSTYRDYAVDIHQSGERLLAVINDVLDMARSEAELMPVEQDWIPLDAMLADMHRRFSGLAQGRSVGLKVKSADDEISILVDRRRFGRALGNLLSNAAQASDDGAAVMLSWRLVEGRELEFVVRDEGPGLTADEIHTALQPFGQVQDHRTRKGDGAGLGLPLAERLCQIHGGSLKLSSESGCGVTAVVWLPADRVRVGP